MRIYNLFVIFESKWQCKSRSVFYIVFCASMLHDNGFVKVKMCREKGAFRQWEVWGWWVICQSALLIVIRTIGPHFGPHFGPVSLKDNWWRPEIWGCRLVKPRINSVRLAFQSARCANAVTSKSMTALSYEQSIPQQLHKLRAPASRVAPNPQRSKLHPYWGSHHHHYCKNKNETEVSKPEVIWNFDFRYFWGSMWT